MPYIPSDNAQLKQTHLDPEIFSKSYLLLHRNYFTLFIKIFLIQNSLNHALCATIYYNFHNCLTFTLQGKKFEMFILLTFLNSLNFSLCRSVLLINKLIF